MTLKNYMQKRKFTSFVKKAFFQLGDDVNNVIEVWLEKV